MYSADKKKTIDAILGPAEEDSQESSESGPEALHAIAEEMIDAFHAKDVAAVAACLKAAFQECESQPHKEGSHIEED